MLKQLCDCCHSSFKQALLRIGQRNPGNRLDCGTKIPKITRKMQQLLINYLTTEKNITFI